MYYIGSHYLNDKNRTHKYDSSSKRLNRAIKKRPDDFRRKFLSIQYDGDKKSIQKEEQVWLDMIKNEELNLKYYNSKKLATGGNGGGWFHKESTKQLYSRQRKGRLISKEWAAKSTAHLKNRKKSEKELLDVSNRMKNNTYCLGRKTIHNDLDEEKRVLSSELQKYLDDGWILGLSESHKAKNRENSNKAKLKNQGSEIYTNGKKEIRLNEKQSIPDGFYKGRIENATKLKNKITCNNGFIEMKVFSNEIPEGFYEGRLPSVIKKLQEKPMVRDSKTGRFSIDEDKSEEQLELLIEKKVN